MPSRCLRNFPLFVASLLYPHVSSDFSRVCCGESSFSISRFLLSFFRCRVVYPKSRCLPISNRNAQPSGLVRKSRSSAPCPMPTPLASCAARSERSCNVDGNCASPNFKNAASPPVPSGLPPKIDSSALARIAIWPSTSAAASCLSAIAAIVSVFRPLGCLAGHLRNSLCSVNCPTRKSPAAWDAITRPSSPCVIHAAFPTRPCSIGHGRLLRNGFWASCPMPFWLGNFPAQLTPSPFAVAASAFLRPSLNAILGSPRRFVSLAKSETRKSRVSSVVPSCPSIINAWPLACECLTLTLDPGRTPKKNSSAPCPTAN